MKKLLLCFLILFANANDLENALKSNTSSVVIQNQEWIQFDRKFIFEAPQNLQDESVDFKNYLNAQFAKILENGENGEQTDSNLDFANQSLELKNLSTLYEYENNTLLFQKEIYIAEQNYNYSGGLINRYKQEDFLLGVNTFVDGQEDMQNHSFGGEFGYSKYFKTYANYYIPDDEAKQRVAEFGMSFVFPYYTPLGIDISRDFEKVDYKISYSPYSIFNLSLVHHDYNELDPNTSVHFGFTIRYDKHLLKQLTKNDNALEEIHRYDYLKRNKYY
ncbi:inverse autotransporter beta domain-containing protein [Campylobacter sp. US33a]|uniref:Inverse autotransporter beta domain-containing protein n=1 Tax=Campylobacter sp. CCS1377 TaxID=3158229 RepID=A0AAU7E6F5_9BACT|nr:inverse autotransporter beta domain-containing protein [Campylobacter sp. US33a]MCW1360519.1 inverse autotransporter beta domain-containing protein [Campylobacter jejuni]TEY03538.1 hypothetical protein ELQ16_03015 [Campylobacter sp. US33a]